MANPASLTRRSFLAISLSASALWLAGCPSGNTGGGASGKVAGVLRYPLVTEPTSLDPALVTDLYTADILINVHLGLVGWSPDNAIVPTGAAELPKVSDDGTVYTFVLRDGLKFHNGRAVTAEDVKYSITRSLEKDLASPVALSYLGDIVGAKAVFEGKAQELSGVVAVDAKTVRITIDKARPYFLGKLTYPTAFIVAKEEIAKGPKTPGGALTLGSANYATAGCGPFKLVNYTPQDRVVLEANPDFVLGKPKLTRIERPIVLDPKMARTLYDTGQLDLINLEKSNYEKDRDDPALKDQIHFFNRASVVYLAMNQLQYAPFKDRRVREAFAHAIDRDALRKNVLLDVDTKAEGVLPAGMPGFQKDFKGYGFDTAKAKSLLAAAGFADGKGLPPLTLSLQQQQPDLIKSAQVIKEQLAAIGVTLDIKEMEWGAILAATANRQLDCYLNGWSADYLDPQDFLSLLFFTGVPENRTGYSNPRFDALCAKADVEKDATVRFRLYSEAERILVDDAPWVPLYYARTMELMKPHVHGLRDCLMGHLPHLTTTVE